MQGDASAAFSPREGATPSRDVRLVECHDCGLFIAMPARLQSATAKCPRCAATLRRFSADPLDRALAYTIAGLILIALANLTPFLSFRLEGRVQDASLVTGTIELFRRGMWPLAAVVLLTTIMAPFAKLGAMLYVLTALRLSYPPRHLPRVFRWIEHLHPWAMIEVYMLGVFVAYVKLIDLATIQMGVALFALAALMVMMAAANAALDPEAVWEQMERRNLVRAPAPSRKGKLSACESCGFVSDMLRPAGHDCPRCGAKLHHRRPNSIATTWALVLTACILYIPANVYPVMTVISFGRGEPDTILSGVKHLFEGGMWPLALLVCFASVIVPMLKLAGLTVLLVSVQTRAGGRLRDRTFLYRIVEAVGRWSMIDIFMLSILVALVRLGSVATIEPGVGATSFAAVVIVTMVAAMAFDPRLMWDAAGKNHE